MSHGKGLRHLDRMNKMEEKRMLEKQLHQNTTKSRKLKHTRQWRVCMKIRVARDSHDYTLCCHDLFFFFCVEAVHRQDNKGQRV
ncbi:hypothetical protein D0Y65_039117 [Glycine soja]|uniref:Uncharacterized protein n=1 Tax=Glycine soja TaxID=3848 RepID=A0A445H7H0_GLYSO|nr:hypothetical protein D0Y65_039117 [Glycine soja]